MSTKPVIAGVLFSIVSAAASGCVGDEVAEAEQALEVNQLANAGPIFSPDCFGTRTACGCVDPGRGICFTWDLVWRQDEPDGPYSCHSDNESSTTFFDPLCY